MFPKKRFADAAAQVVVPASSRGRVKEVLADGKPCAETMKDKVR